MPEIYLGVDVGTKQLPDGRVVWTTSSKSYVTEAVKTVENLLIEDGEGYVLKNRVKNPFPSNYKPELDVTDELGPELSLRYLQLVGICRWAVELGRIDIICERWSPEWEHREGRLYRRLDWVQLRVHRSGGFPEGDDTSGVGSDISTMVAVSLFLSTALVA